MTHIALSGPVVCTLSVMRVVQRRPWSKITVLKAACVQKARLASAGINNRSVSPYRAISQSCRRVVYGAKFDPLPELLSNRALRHYHGSKDLLAKDVVRIQSYAKQSQEIPADLHGKDKTRWDTLHSHSCAREGSGNRLPVRHMFGRT